MAGLPKSRLPAQQLGAAAMKTRQSFLKFCADLDFFKAVLHLKFEIMIGSLVRISDL